MNDKKYYKYFPRTIITDREIRCHYDESSNSYVLQLYEKDSCITSIKFGGVSVMQETIRHWLTEKINLGGKE